MKKVVRDLAYKWKQGSRVKVKPTVAAKELDRLKAAAKKRKEPFGSAHVVAAAKSTRNPLHGEFEWNNAKAAHAHRLEKARYIIRSLEVVVTKKVGGKVQSSQTLRQYTSLGTGTEDGEDSQFHDTQDVLSDAEMRLQVLTKIWRQLVGLRRQYVDYKEFAEVWSAIDDVEDGMAAAAAAK